VSGRTKRVWTGTLVTLVLAFGLGCVSAKAQSIVPVQVGGDADLDACGALGKVHGLDPNGDNYLSVRGGPSPRSKETDRLAEGDAFHVCDERGDWLGVVYGDGPCGVGSPIAKRRTYRGKCRSGWVHGRYVQVEAG
jgi:hypothetical protein